MNPIIAETGWKTGKEGLGKDVVFHTLRHTYISRLVRTGVSLRTVQELAGHKEIKMTMRYAHLAPEQKRQAVDELEREVPSEFTTLKETTFVNRSAPVAQLDRASDF